MYPQMSYFEEKALLDFENFLLGRNFFSFFLFILLELVHNMSQTPTDFGKTWIWV